MNTLPARVGLTALCGILAMVNAPIVFASAAPLALDGRGIYRTQVTVAFLCAASLLIVGIALLITAVLAWRDRPQVPRLARRLALVQLILTVAALVVAYYASPQILLTLLLLLGGLCSVLLWFVWRGEGW